MAKDHSTNQTFLFGIPIGSQRCRTCEAHKPFAEFPRNRRMKNGYHPICSVCQSAYLRKWRERNRHKEEPAAEGTKRCRRCHEAKPVTEFYRVACRRDGRNEYCRTCAAITHKATMDRVKSDPVRSKQYKKMHRNGHLKRTYGITHDEYEAMYAAQKGRCAICGRLEGDREHRGQTPKQWFHIDHDHKTGKVRSLLCYNCNSGLGQFRDNPTLLRTAADYLERHQQVP